MSTSTDSQLLGVVLIARHGDRQGFYQDPESYTASATSITPLGETQEYQLGDYIRSRYLNSSLPEHIKVDEIFNAAQVAARADAGGEGGVIFDSSIALLQGLFPPSSARNISLANGTTVLSPLGGYQYVPVESVEPNQDVSLEGFTSCNTLTSRTTALYNSPAFLAKGNQSEAFLKSLPPYLDGRPVTLANMWNIFDYMNVQSIHNSTFFQRLPPTFLQQARDLANFHEYNVFTDSTLDGIGNIAGRAMLPSILTAMKRIANETDPLKLHYSAVSYKPPLSLFKMIGVVDNGQLPPAIINYAAALAFEIRKPSNGGELTVRFNFKNGSDDDAFKTYSMSLPGFENTQDVPLSAFLSTLSPPAVNTTLQWCQVCGQDTDRGCAALLGAAGTSITFSDRNDRISPVGAGFLGAGLTFAVMSMLLALLVFAGWVSFGKKARKSSSMRGLHSADSQVNSVNTVEKA